MYQSDYISCYREDNDLLYVEFSGIFYRGKKICNLGFKTSSLCTGQSLGLVLTSDRNLHWFVDLNWRGVVHVNGFPLDRSLWGIADVCGVCKKVKAEVCNGKYYSACCTIYTVVHV